MAARKPPAKPAKPAKKPVVQRAHTTPKDDAPHPVPAPTRPPKPLKPLKPKPDPEDGRITRDEWTRYHHHVVQTAWQHLANGKPCPDAQCVLMRARIGVK